jgi:hypothetical protein
VAGEAMNVRGGNGYIEEWVNPRLLRDAYLGAIWEGASNVVALDVQRAIARDGCLAPLAAHLQARLDRVADPDAKAWVEEVRGSLAAVQREVAAWGSRPDAGRELAARPVAEALYHALASTLLLAEGQALLDARGDARKLVAAGLYVRRWLRGGPPLGSVFAARHLALLDPLADWTPVDHAAVADLER